MGSMVWADRGLTTTSEREDAVFWDSVFSHNHVFAIPRRKDGQTGEKGPKVDFGNQLNCVKADVVIDNKPFKGTDLRFKGNSLPAV